MGESWRSELRRGSYLLAGASGLLLLVAALNVMALLLARSVVRRRELTIRSALGAGRGRLMRQSLTETLILVGAGGLLGIAAGPPLLRAFLEISTVGLPQYVDARPDALALAVSFVVVALAALVAGLGPALLGARTDLTETLGEGGRGAAGGRTLRRWGAGLVFAEVALTMVLVVAASFMIRTYRALATEDLGYDADRAVRTALFIEAGDVPLADDPRPLYDRLLREVAAEPGVESVGLVFPTVPIVRPTLFPVRWSGMPETLSESGLRVGYFSADSAPTSGPAPASSCRWWGSSPASACCCRRSASTPSWRTRSPGVAGRSASARRWVRPPAASRSACSAAGSARWPPASPPARSSPGR